MREQFHEELAGLSERMVEMTRLVGSAVSRATTALLDADLALAESVIGADDQADEPRQHRRPGRAHLASVSCRLPWSAASHPCARALLALFTWRSAPVHALLRRFGRHPTTKERTVDA